MGLGDNKFNIELLSHHQNRENQILPQFRWIYIKVMKNFWSHGFRFQKNMGTYISNCEEKIGGYDETSISSFSSILTTPQLVALDYIML